jgi:hypothetical protein
MTISAVVQDGAPLTMQQLSRWNGIDYVRLTYDAET